MTIMKIQLKFECIIVSIKIEAALNGSLGQSTMFGLKIVYISF